MPPSLCCAMAATRDSESTSHAGPAACTGPASSSGTDNDSDSYLASMPLAGSIGTWIVARLYFELPQRRRPPNVGRVPGRTVAGRQAVGVRAGSSRKEPPVAGACTVAEALR